MTNLNYFKNHPWYNNKSKRNKQIFDYYTKLTFDLKNFMDIFNEKSSFLEIWFWIWKFANFLKKKWITKYTWIDIDDTFLKINKNKFNNFTFLKSKFQIFLKNTNNKYDTIFTSHVFEHLDNKETSELIKLIFQSLKKWGVWVNIMPNADSVIWWVSWRYIDITHKTIYNINSFEQTIALENVNFKLIKHLNSYIWQNFIKRIIHLIFLFFTKIYYTSMWRTFPKIYTWEIISLCYK